MVRFFFQFFHLLFLTAQYFCPVAESTPHPVMETYALVQRKKYKGYRVVKRLVASRVDEDSRSIVFQGRGHGNGGRDWASESTI